MDYDEIAKTYDRRYRENQYPGVAQALVHFSVNEPGRRVLEVGCGTGYWLGLLGRRGIWLAGLDPSARMLSRAREHVPQAGLVRGRAERLPWKDGSFDRVFCINALHHFNDKPEFFSEARRVLRPSGALMTVGLDPHTGLDRWCIYDYFEGTRDMDRNRYPASYRIRKWMAEAGFEGCSTFEAEHIVIRSPGREALERGKLDKTTTSQLAILTDEEYGWGINRIREDLESAESRGEPFYLDADLRLYATVGSAGPPKLKVSGFSIQVSNTRPG